jgi:hypothetical protein
MFSKFDPTRELKQFTNKFPIMKRYVVFFAFVILLSSVLTAQNSGKGFNFQAVARNADGSIQSEQEVQLSISIYPTDEKTAVLYRESHTVTTDKFGVFSLVIGKGVYQAGSAASFEEIDFSLVNAWLNVVLKEGGNDVEIAHAPLLSVPYAETSKQADNGMPIGAIIPYAGAVPDNSDDITVYGCAGTWRLCNGAEYDPMEFTSLHLVLNDTWGTHRLPDLRGVFLRGTNYTAADAYADPDAAARDRRGTDDNVGNEVGSFQSDAMQNVTGTIGEFNTYAAFKGTSTGPFKNTWIRVNEGIGSGSDDSYHKIDFDLSRSARTSTESRPLNANVNFIIRVK